MGASLASVWSVWGRALSRPRPLVLSRVRPGATTRWLGVRGVRVWGLVTDPTARALASWLCALWGRHKGARGGRLLHGWGASGDGCSPTPNLSSCRRAAGARFPLALGAVLGRGGPASPVPRFVVCCARFPGSRHPVAVVAWHLCSCRGCGRRRASLACFLAPRWCAAPGPVRSLSVLCSVSRRRGALPHTRGCLPRLYWVAARGTWRPAENRALCACRWLLPRQGRWASSASYLFRAPRWGCPWRVPPASVLGCMRCAGLACVDPITDGSGFLYRPSFDGGLGRCAGAVSCRRRHLLFRVGGRPPRPRACARVCAFLAGLSKPASWARFGAPDLFLWPFLVPSLSAGLLRAGVALLVVFSCFLPLLCPPCVLCFVCPPPHSCGFFLVPLFCAPLVSGVPCFLALGAFSLGGPRWFFFSAHPWSLAFRVFWPWVPWALASCCLPPPPSCFFPVPWCAGCAVLRLCLLGSGACWSVLLWALCFGGGLCALALCRSVPPASASSFCVVACRVARARWGRAGSVAPPRAASGVCPFCPPPPPPVVVSSVVLCCAPCRVAPRPVVCFVLCPVVCGVLVSGWVLAPCCLARCGAGPCCAVFVLLCCPALLRSLFVLGSRLVPGCFCFCALLMRCGAGVPASLLSVRCLSALAALAGVVACCVCVFAVGPCCPLLSAGGSWWLLVSCLGGVLWCVTGCCAAPCCCAVQQPGVALWSAVLIRFALFGVAAHCVVSWGAVRRPGVLRLLAPSLVLSPRALCVLLWRVAAWCCSPLCFVPFVPWGVLLCVFCRLCPVRCCCVARLPSVPCSPSLCPVVLWCRVVLWCPVLLPCWVCFLRSCGFTYLYNRCKFC